MVLNLGKLVVYRIWNETTIHDIDNFRKLQPEAAKVLTVLYLEQSEFVLLKMEPLGHLFLSHRLRRKHQG